MLVETTCPHNVTPTRYGRAIFKWCKDVGIAVSMASAYSAGHEFMFCWEIPDDKVAWFALKWPVLLVVDEFKDE